MYLILFHGLLDLMYADHLVLTNDTAECDGHDGIGFGVEKAHLRMNMLD